MGKYLDPKADLTFKRVFGEHADLLKSFLNAVLPLENGTEILSLEYLSPEMIPDNPAKKYSIVDVQCHDNLGRQFIVEMQMYWNGEFLKRTLFNASKAFVRPLTKGKDYDELREVYSLSIVNDIAFPEQEDKFYHRYILTDTADRKYTINGFELIFVELPKFTPSSISDKKMQALWLRFLTEIDTQTHEAPKDMLDNKDVSKALEIVEQGAYTDAQMMAYDKFWDEIRSERTLLKGSFKLGLEKGMEEGMKKGMKKGREEGMKEGMEQGQKMRAKEIACNLKSLGLTTKQIIKATGLSEEEINSL